MHTLILSQHFSATINFFKDTCINVYEIFNAFVQQGSYDDPRKSVMPAPLNPFRIISGFDFM